MKYKYNYMNKDNNMDIGKDIMDIDSIIDNKTIRFPDNVWYMICCYCDDRIERKQRKIMRSIRTIRQFGDGTGQIMITAYIHTYNNAERIKRILNSYLKNSIVWVYTNNKCVSLNEFIANNIG